jgi:transcriptional regulator with XRE-family HTH domain
MTQSTPVRDQNGPAIRALRKRSGLSVRDLCSLLEEQEGLTVHPNHIRNVETNARGASEGLIAAIARVLKVPTVAILAAPAEAKVSA